ncbi:oligosaccharide flippase family protein [Bacillus sp. MB2021]|uniref:oligosaccharide flippase family protein n=1 Tax=Bacillus sp. MB2021 TaxID=1408303 RepID=UPI0004E1E4D9|nr:oligosaccharide flippase family protein [Bacillus sp. MB2021]
MYKQSLYLSISKGLKSISALIITMIIARVLSQEDYGIYRQYILITSLLGGILIFGIPTAVSYLFKNIKSENISKLFINTSLLLGVISFITITFLIFFKKNVVALISHNGEINSIFSLAIVYIVILIFFSFLENIYISDGQGYIFAKINIVYYILYMIAISVTSYILKSLFEIVFLMVVFELIKGMILYIYYIRFRKLDLSFDKKLLKQEFTVAIPIGISAIAQTANSYLGNLYVSSNYDVRSFALYSVGVTEIPFISIITLSISTALLPTLSYQYKTEKNQILMLKTWNDSVLLGAIIIFPIYWILLFWSNGYIEFIFSKNYLSATEIYQIYLLKLPLAITVFGNILVVLNKSKYIFYNMLFALIFNLVSMLILDKYIGLNGVALSSVITQLLLVIITILQIKKSLSVKLFDVIPLGKLGVYFISTFLITLIVFLVSNILDNQIISFFIFGGLSFCIILFVFYKFGVLEKYLKDLNIRRVRGKK